MHFRFLHIVKNFIVLLLVAFVMDGCRLTRYVPEGKSLLRKVSFRGEIKDFKSDDLLSCVQQKPPRAFLVSIYSYSNIEKDNWWNKMLRSFGEEPVIYDPENTNMSTKYLKRFFNKNGYYEALVVDSVHIKSQKAYVSYSVRLGKPYTLRKVSYDVADTFLRNFVLADTVSSVVKPGSLLNEYNLTSERSRIENYLHNNGFFRFNHEVIHFYPDTTLGGHLADLVISVENPKARINDSVFEEKLHYQYKYKNVVVNTLSDLTVKPSNISPTDTFFAGGLKFTYKDKKWVKPSTVLQANFVTPGSLYSLADIEKSKQQITALGTYSLVSISQLKEVPNSDTSRFRLLDCNFQLTTPTMQSITWELEGTSTAGDLGGAVSMVYQHLSLFHGAENFRLKLKGAVRSTKHYGFVGFNRLLEYGAESSLTIPKFMFPIINTARFAKRYNPKTSFSLSYNYMDRPDFSYYGTNIMFGYIWKGGANIIHQINPFEVNVVKVPRYNDSVVNSWGPYIKSQFSSHIVTAISYTLEYKTPESNRVGNKYFLRFNIETAGNSLLLYSKLSGNEAVNGTYKLQDISYSQYAKSYIDWSYVHPVDNNRNLAGRLFFGVAKPYGNSVEVPFEKKFFCGGANSVRGWGEKNLGPGSYSGTDGIFANFVTGDLRLEANLEYRAPIVGVLEGALFSDAGNIWSISPKDLRKGAVFHFDEFYRQIALSSGLGLRFKFTVLLLRLDLGMKVFSPSQEAGKKWVFQRRVLAPDNFALGFGIGYPF